MFAVIYQFKLKPHQEKLFQEYWHTLAMYFVEKRGAIGSCLHKGADGLWVAYSRWPDKATRDASWPDEDAPNDELPQDIRDTIQKIQAIRDENQHLEKYTDICLDVVEDLLLPRT